MKASVSVVLPFLVAGLSSCGTGGSGGNTTPPNTTYTVGGFVNDLNNSPLTLLNNGRDKVTVPTFGNFTFPSPMSSGATYNVTVGTQPTNGQTCQVQNGTGTVTGNINTVLVTCLGPFKIGGSVFGLAGSGLTLQDNGTDTLQILSNGPFQFSSTLAFGEAYTVTITAQPTNPTQRCTITNSSGTPQDNVANILVTCGSAGAKWTWMGGSQSIALAGIYGQLGVAAPGNNPGARGEGVSWTDSSGNFWLFGGTYSDAGNNLNDLWKYSNSEWAWITGSSTGNNEQGVYGTLGTPAATNVPGARIDPVSWTDSSGNLWLFGGYGSDLTGYHWYNDLWRFTGNEWTWVSGSSQPDQPPVYGSLGTASPTNVPGARYGAMTWIDASNNLWLFGGRDVNLSVSGGSSRDQNDFWKFNGSEWTWIAGSNNPGAAQSGVYGTLGTPAAANTPGAREDGATWTDAAGAFWLFGGIGQDSAGNLGSLNDLWRFKNGEWSWMGGSDTVGDLGTFGTMGIADAGNIPPARSLAMAWTDSAGNFWLFGGGGADRSGNDGALNDLWKYSGGQWTYMSGSELARQPSSYGPLGTVSAESLPGGCAGKMKWIDQTGKLWAYCENENDPAGLITSANDLWVYNP